MLNTILLISIKPEYAKLIFETKTKKIELRRVRTRLTAGDIVLVYVSSPEKVFIGSFEVEDVIERKASRQELRKFWEKFQDSVGISHQEFYSYYEGASLIVGILIKDIRNFEKPVPLKCLPKKLSYLRPPQSYRYLEESEYNIINSLGKDKKSIMTDQ
jgi:predicted transcriptional regulator